MKNRIAMLDVLRGLAMFFIVGGDTIVLALCGCFSGSVSSEIQKQFGHFAWEGFRFYDAIFPTFLLVSGTAFTFSAKRWRDLLIRTLVLIVLGVLYNGALSAESFADIRFPSVLARIGLGVLLAAIPYRFLPAKGRVLFLPVGLLLYGALFPLCGGYADAAAWAGEIDAALIPNAHGLDPEGVISTLGAMLTAYLGMLLGDFLRSSISRKPLWMALAGVVLIGLAWGVSPVCPIIKKLWTSSYVCLAGGWTLVVAAGLYLLTDTLQLKRLFAPVAFIGVHALWFYLLPRFVDFQGTAWRLIALPVRSLTEELSVQRLLLAMASFLLLFGSVWFICRRMRKA